MTLQRISGKLTHTHNHHCLLLDSRRFSCLYTHIGKFAEIILEFLWNVVEPHILSHYIISKKLVNLVQKKKGIFIATMVILLAGTYSLPVKNRLSSDSSFNHK